MYILDVKMSVQLLQALVQRLQGDETTLEMTGYLSELDTHLLPEAKFSDWPRSGGERGVDIPLTEDNVKTLVRSILPRVGLRKKIHTIRILHDNKLLFYAEDNFMQWAGVEGRYNKGAGVTSKIESAFLDELVAKGILRNYSLHEPPSEHWE